MKSLLAQSQHAVISVETRERGKKPKFDIQFLIDSIKFAFVGNPVISKTEK